ncbi:MAG: enoyl-CoA hydratase/isomerase family protein [Bacteroidetes bacterium]|nr:enoyl-CoA hydratase/isomerase family protein [Bacteroidota bacterium]MBL6944679.1 enoyl-CoA hydratase/isomerase family protein [Bacteroidales bacterium]
MRQSTLQTLGLGTVLEIFKKHQLPANSSNLVDQVFGANDNRGSLVISGANGIVGAGKAMQLGSRLEAFGVPIVGLDFPGTPDGIGNQFPGLVEAFGAENAQKIMANIIRLNYNGKNLPKELKELKPRFLLEAIPEILEIKKAHYKLFRESFPGVEIRSVTSGFPSSELGVGIAHPAFPHEINKVWEVVEPEPSNITKLLWSLGLIPVPVSDHWSFVLDVLFCGITLAGLRYHQATNMPYWKIDKYIRKFIGPNPFRAHDVIGAKGANFLTWSCLHHLGNNYGELFIPTLDLTERKETGQDWYPPDHFRPMVNWRLDDDESDDFLSWTLGPLFQMTSILLHEQRGNLSNINAIGELCAQFRSGIIATIRDIGADSTIKRVASYHKLHPVAASTAWYPEVFEKMNDPEWQQLYVNAEHDGKVGVITISRESYNHDVDSELNRAIDWLKKEGIHNVIVTGDFHLATQMVGADTSDFFPALENVDEGDRVASTWSLTARRLHNEFKVSVGYINGKRCMGGFLELLIHCHYLVTTDEVKLGMPEVTLPVVPGMEGCHWPFRKTIPENWPKLLKLLLVGNQVKAIDTTGWLCDYTGTQEEALEKVWKLANEEDHGLKLRKVVDTALEGIPTDVQLPASDNEGMETARKVIMETIKDSCSVSLSEALSKQSKHSANFMISKHCKTGTIGTVFNQVMNI